MTVVAIIAVLVALAHVDARAVDPSIVLPGAQRVYDLGGGRSSVTLRDGATARVEPIREGILVTFSDGRPSERWMRTATGYTVTRSRPVGPDYTRRVDGRTATRGSGSRVTVAPTRDGHVVSGDLSSTIWVTSRSGATAWPPTLE